MSYSVNDHPQTCPVHEWTDYGEEGPCPKCAYRELQEAAIRATQAYSCVVNTHKIYGQYSGEHRAAISSCDEIMKALAQIAHAPPIDTRGP